MNATEKFWTGEFGDEYQRRQKEQARGNIPANTAFFAKVLSSTHDVQRVIELGCGTGQNLVAINRLLPHAALLGVEINENAAKEVPFSVVKQSILDVNPNMVKSADLVFTKGVLIHIDPDELYRVYDVLYRCSRRYVLIAEYFNPTPTEVNYRGNTGVLWKRDFAGELMDTYPDLRLVDYGFTWARDPNFPQDSVTWFLMEKQ